MEFDLKPMASETMFEGDGGAYYTWSSSKYPLLGKANVGSGQLVLQPRGFALPHYGDCPKGCFVLHGTGIVGMVLPSSREEVVLKLKKGDLLPQPAGTVTWWFNNGESEFIVSFLGETSGAHIPGQFAYFLLTGTQGVLRAFSSEVLSKAYNLNTDEAEELTESQDGAMIIKLEDCQTMPSPQMDITKELVYNIEDPENYDAENGGSVSIITEKSFPFVGQTGQSFVRVKLEPNAIKAPVYEANAAVELIYIAKGSGKVEIVGIEGKTEMDKQVKQGDLLLVPQFLVITVIAGEEPMEYISLLNTPKPVFQELAGNGSMWEAMSPLVQEVAFNVKPEFVKLFLSKIKNTSNMVIIPRTKY